MDRKDYYEILGVEADASQQEIKEAYRRLALKYHPDRNKANPAAASKMTEINESYAVLSDPQKRARYDSLKEAYGSSAYGQFRQTYSEHDIFTGSDIQQIFEEISRAFGLRGFDELFKGQQFYRTFEFRRPGSFSRVFVGPSMQRSNTQTSYSLGGPIGKLIRYGMKKIWGVELPEKGKDLRDVIAVPPELAHSGGKILYHCRLHRKELVVAIPAGIKGSQRIRLKGMGKQGKGGGEPGDLYLEIRIKKQLLQRIQGFLKGVWSSGSEGRL